MPVYILMGEEPYYIDKIVERIEESVVAEEDREFDQSILYGADSNAAVILEAVSRFPLMSEKRLVILKEAQSMAQAKTNLNKLQSYISNPNNASILVIAFKGEKLEASSAMMKAAKMNSNVIVFESPKIKEYKLGEVIKDYCYSQKISIEEQAIDILISNIGSSLVNLFSEIDKLKLALKKDEKRIVAEMVLSQTGISKEFNNFELVSALARKDYFQAVRIVKYFQENAKSNPTSVTAGRIFAYFQNLVIAAFSQDRSDKSLMEALQLKNPYALREIRTGLNSYNASQLVNVIHEIRGFDAKSKGIGSFQNEFSLLRELVCTIITL